MRRRKFMLILAVINLFICVAGLLEWKSDYKGQEHTNNYI
ncbi:Ribosyl nicotinamide transporter PnuC-like protein [Bacillus cereus]|nr:Ribosyl nicotinamide transporter PnuC-like protein [Bacillus cereus]